MIRVHLSQNPIKFECLWFLWFFVKTSWQQPQNETENRKLSTFNFQLSTFNFQPRENTRATASFNCNQDNGHHHLKTIPSSLAATFNHANDTTTATTTHSNDISCQQNQHRQHHCWQYHWRLQSFRFHPDAPPAAPILR